MTNVCRHCRHSMGYIAGLWCSLHGRQAIKACVHWEREPGSDDDIVPAEADQDWERNPWDTDEYRQVILQAQTCPDYQQIKP